MALVSLPFHALKMDRTCLACLSDSTQSRAVMSMIVTLSRQRQLIAVAGGIETSQQQNLFAARVCDCVQGDLHAPPLALVEFEKIAFV